MTELVAGAPAPQPARATAVGVRQTGFWETRASGFILVAALLCLWEASVRFGLVQSENWPAFTVVMVSLYTGISDGEMLKVILSTLGRMVQGYGIGVVIGVPLGFAIALSRTACMALQPTIELLRPVPIPAVIPPLIFILGIDDGLKIFSIAFATLFPITLNTRAGVLAVEPVYRQVAQTFGAPRGMTLLRVVFPAALPFIMAGLRTSLGLALVVAVVAEMIAGQQGVGYYLVSMQFAMRAADMYAVVILLACVAYLINRAFLSWEGRVIRWARLRETMGGDAL